MKQHRQVKKAASFESLIDALSSPSRHSVDEQLADLRQLSCSLGPHDSNLRRLALQLCETLQQVAPGAREIRELKEELRRRPRQ